MRFSVKHCIVLSLWVTAVQVNAQTQPKFTIEPSFQNANVIKLSAAAVTNVTYLVTNRTSLTRTLTIEPIAGISVIEALGGCTNPFTLAPGESCNLTLYIDGGKLSADAPTKGPKVCATKSAQDNTANPFLCSQPSQTNALNISMYTPIAYITNLNQTTDVKSVTQCLIDLNTGTFNNCKATNATLPDGSQISDPVSIAVNLRGSQAYILDAVNDKIYTCDINPTTGNLSNCYDSGATGLTGALRHLSLNPKNNWAYVARSLDNDTGSITYKCPVNPELGTFGACTETAAAFTFARKMESVILNKDGTRAYVVYSNESSSLTQCGVDSNNDLINCVTSTFFDPTTKNGNAIFINADQTFAYISGSSTVFSCPLDSSGIIANNSCVDMLLSANVDNPREVILDARETHGYVINAQSNFNNVTSCPIDSTTGSFIADQCIQTPTTSPAYSAYMDNPNAIAFR